MPSVQVLLLLLCSLFVLVRTEEGFQVVINGVEQLIPYGTRESYLAVCRGHQILPTDECADAFEKKGLERILKLESLYSNFLFQNRKNIDLIQQNSIVLKEIKTNKEDNNKVCEKEHNAGIRKNNEAILEYESGLSSVGVQSVRHHFCHDAIKALPKEVLEPILNFDRAHEPVPMLKQLTSREELLVLLNQLQLNGEAAELGVHRGEFSERILSIWKKGRLHMVDVWGAVDHYLYDRNDDLNQAINRVSKFGSKRYKIVRNLTTHAAGLYPDGYFDFLYLDATHTYFEARRDLQIWYAKLKKGGIFAGDDYINGNVEAAGYRFGVKDAVDEFTALYNLRVNVMWKDTKPELGGPMPQWYIYKC